jgi:hypothetical protein
VFEARPTTAPDRETFADLERRITDLDALPEDSAEASAKRRVLLVMLDQYGFFDPERQPGLRRGLWQGPWTAVGSVRAAAQSLTEYLSSPQRARFNPEQVNRKPDAAGAPISIDWFRFPSPTPDLFEDPLVWTSWCEAWLRAARIEDPSPGRGEVFAQLAGRWCRLRWRTDDGRTPALLAADAVDG